MKTRKKLSQQILDRLSTLYEYADGDLMDGDEGMATAPRPVATTGDQQRAAESERLLGRLLRAHEGVPAGDG